MKNHLKTIISQPGRQTLIFLSWLIIASAAVYYFYALDIAGIIISFILAISGFLATFNLLQKNENLERPEEIKKISWWQLIIYFCVWVGLWYLLFQVRTDRPLISPWEVVPPLFFWGYAGLSLFLFFYLAGQKRFSNLLIGAHLLLLLGIAALIYKLGYGFDPFIHEASLRYIDQHGAILPKTFYYLGEYGLFTILYKIFHLPFSLLNAWAVPVLAALTLPNAANRFLKRLYPAGQDSSLILTIMLLWPLSAFIFTTPQSLAYIFLILSLFEILPAPGKFDGRFYLGLLFAGASAAIHPLAGLPALALIAFTALHVWQPEKSGRRTILNIILIILGAAIIPLALVIGNHATFSGTTWLASLKDLVPSIIWTAKENPLLNALYLLIFNQGWLFCLLAGFGIYGAGKQKILKGLTPAILAISAVFLAWLGSTGLDFPGLIDYEQSGYAKRLLAIIVFFSLPFTLLAAQIVIRKWNQTSRFTSFLGLLFLTLLLTANLYALYPRRDNYYNSHGLSVSATDLQTVAAIEKQAGGKDYIVLADQTVGAAALKTFGFERSYRTASGQEIFFYPIPTSGPLYQFYLAMVYKKPAKSVMAAAMDLAGVKEGYFVINKYWLDFPKVVAAAKVEADSWQALADNSVYIFYYKR
jgi:hypothetical protein